MISRSLLSSRRLRGELTIVLGLITMAVLVFLAYLFPGASSWFESKNFLSIIVAILLFLVIVGFIIITHIVNPIITISKEAQIIADGNLSYAIEMSQENEIGDLGAALNRMTQKMRGNIEELRKFSKETELVNIEINKRVLILSSLLQISSLIAQNADLKEVIEVGVGKCLALGNMTFAGLILKEQSSSEYYFPYIVGDAAEKFFDQGIKNYKIRLGEGLLGKTILRRNIVILDRDTVASPEIQELKNFLLISNAVIVPIVSKGNVYGLLIAGNNLPDFISTSAEKELLQLIAKQIAIAKSNEILKNEIEKLNALDPLTGLYNSAFARNYLNDEIKKAMMFHVPCALVLIAIDDFEQYYQEFGRIAAENVLTKIGTILKSSVRGIDKAARLGDHEFGLIIPKRNKRQCIDIAEEIRKKIEGAFTGESDPQRRITCTFAVTENPLDGMNTEELISKAEGILLEIKPQGRNKVCYKA